MNSDWKTPNDVKKTYANAGILKDSRIVFNIKGNSCRLVAKFSFEKQWTFQIEAPDPIEAIKIRMEEMQLKQVDLADVIGGKNRISEVLKTTKMTPRSSQKYTPLWRLHNR